MLLCLKTPPHRPNYNQHPYPKKNLKRFRIRRPHRGRVWQKQKPHPPHFDERVRVKLRSLAALHREAVDPDRPPPDVPQTKRPVPPKLDETLLPAHLAGVPLKTQILIEIKEMSVPYGQSVGGMW